MTPASHPEQNIPVFGADMFRVISGANVGDALSAHDDLTLDDTYALTSEAERTRLAITVLPGDGLRVAEGTELGRPGAVLHLDCAMTLMSPNGDSAEALVLVELAANRDISNIYLLPLGDLHPKTGYTLVGTDRRNARQKFAQIACVSFAAGTHITMATGAQTPIEKLRVGARVLTRDEGPQTVRWIGQSTVRASGTLAPIVITAGTLNNENDLIVSPDHRLFVYQRSDQMGVGRPDLMVKARHLVNGETVYVQSGGYVDYYQILFDRHHLIYAEGIAAETMLVDPRTRPALPAELLEKLSPMLRDHEAHRHGLDVQEALLSRPDAIDLLRRASTR